MARAPLVLVNPAAGGGRALRAASWIRERLESRADARLVVTSRPGHAESLASEAHARGHGRVIAVGGDGTVQEVINGLLAGGGPVELGIVPLGSGNDLARSLALARGLEPGWRVAIGSRTRTIDVALARNGSGHERWFASAGGIGFDAQVAASMAERSWWQLGRAGYLATTLVELKRFHNAFVTIDVDGDTREASVLFVAIANGPLYGGGMRIAPAARLDDGQLDVCVVGDISRLTALRQLPNLYRGTHVSHPQVAMQRGASITIGGEANTRIHLDGEPFGGLPLAVSTGWRSVEVAVGGH
ncbi:MAG: diacylglycerol kinase family protein [Candidatus Limnocylindria bacterium]